MDHERRRDNGNRGARLYQCARCQLRKDFDANLDSDLGATFLEKNAVGHTTHTAATPSFYSSRWLVTGGEIADAPCRFFKEDYFTGQQTYVEETVTAAWLHGALEFGRLGDDTFKAAGDASMSGGA